jgi:glycosyltransferase involved in cell wall biosynthesis
VRVAVVHERFTEMGGSEAVVEQVVATWPEAVVYAPVVDRDILPAGLRTADVRPGPLDRLYRGGGNYAPLLPLLPAAMVRLRLDDCDVVITSHHAFANRVRPPRPGVPVVSYTHTPARWFYDGAMRRGERGGGVGLAALTAFAATQRTPDRRAAARTTAILANSAETRDRVHRWWERPADILPPPVDTDFFTLDPAIAREDFFLLAGRLVPYKRPEVAFSAARRAGVRLVVAGDGRLFDQLAAEHGDEVEMLGRVPDEALRQLFRRARAVLMPGVEDFGIVPVEAQACGAPVIALGRGGARDTVVPGVTGMLYDGPDEVTALADALRAFDPAPFDPAVLRAHAERFSRAAFRDGLRTHVETALA